jgi:hypothetical protein
MIALHDMQSVAGRDGHARRGGLPHEGDLGRGEAVGLVDEVAQGALQLQGLGGKGAGGFDGAGVFVAQGVEAGGGQGLLLAADALQTTRSNGSRLALTLSLHHLMLSQDEVT